ncbi:MAG: methyltransferase domain-containing protein [Burkholderiaceae bacterium]|jgi:SAM-dependent methyltransferase|nr:methyltransferase domain-containing protein [Burkholderiaceae bacterium]
MERLQFGEGVRYNALEAAIHMARYLIVKERCSGRAVLDVACGEGYGSWLISKWGAKSVLGIDISEEAIANARSQFKAPGLTFGCGAGERLAEIVGPQRFDLIVSLETIEHLDDPKRFLENIKRLANEGATIVISAPNDYWYYDRGGQNEFHKHKFTFEEFKDLTETVLGKAQSWQLGTLGIGFSVTKQNGPLLSGHAGTGQSLMLEFRDIDSAVFVPSQVESDVIPPEAAFYVGVWGKQGVSDMIFAGYPVSMDLGRQALFSREKVWASKPDPSEPSDEIRIAELQKLVSKLQETETKLREAATVAEKHTVELNENLRAVQEKRDFAEKENARLALLLEAAAAVEKHAFELNENLRAVQEKLYFAEKENARLGMSRRAAQAEVASVWRALERHEREKHEITARYNGELQELSNQLNQSRQEIEGLAKLVATQAEELAGIPWLIVRTWWKVRKLIPNFVLRGVGRMLGTMRGVHAN